MIWNILTTIFKFLFVGPEKKQQDKTIEASKKLSQEVKKRMLENYIEKG